MSENPYKDLDDVNDIDLREYQVKVKPEKEQIKRGYCRVQERLKNLRQIFFITRGYHISTRVERFSTRVEIFQIIAIYRILKLNLAQLLFIRSQKLHRESAFGKLVLGTLFENFKEKNCNVRYSNIRGPLFEVTALLLKIS